MTNIITQREHKQIYRDGDKVVKIFDESFSKADVLNEALNLARIEETNLKTPELLNVEKIDGKWAITTTYIEGKTLAELMEEHPEKISLRTQIPKEGSRGVDDLRSPLLIPPSPPPRYCTSWQDTSTLQ